MANVSVLPLEFSQPTDNKAIGGNVSVEAKEKSEAFSNLMEQHTTKEESGKTSNESGKSSVESTEKSKSLLDKQDKSQALNDEEVASEQDVVDATSTEKVNSSDVPYKHLSSEATDVNASASDANVDVAVKIDTSVDVKSDEAEKSQLIQTGRNISNSSHSSQKIENQSTTEHRNASSTTGSDELLTLISDSGKTSTKLASKAEQPGNEALLNGLEIAETRDTTKALSEQDAAKNTVNDASTSINTKIGSGNHVENSDVQGVISKHGVDNKAVDTGSITQKSVEISNKSTATPIVDLAAESFKGEQSPKIAGLNTEKMHADNAKYEDNVKDLSKVSNLSASIRMASNPEKNVISASSAQKEELMQKYVESNRVPVERPEKPQEIIESLSVDDAEALLGKPAKTSKVSSEDKIQDMSRIASGEQQIANVEQNKEEVVNEHQPNVAQLNAVVSGSVDKNIATSLNTLQETKQTPPTINDYFSGSKKGDDSSANKQSNAEQVLVEESAEKQLEDENLLSSNDKLVKADFKNTINPLFDSFAQRDVSQSIQQLNQSGQAERSYENVINTLTTEVTQTQKQAVAQQTEVISIMRKDFNDAVKEKVMVMIHQKIQQVDIQLDPPEFGNMQVRVNLQNEQAVVNFIVQNQQAKDALEQNIDKLKNMLADSGVDVGEANVKQQSKQSNNENGEEQTADNNQGDSFDGDVEAQMDLNSLNVFKASSTGVDYYA